MSAAHRIAMPESALPEALGRMRFGRYAGRSPLRCQASVARSKAAACCGSSAIQRLTLSSRSALRSGPCNSVTHTAAWARMRRILFGRAIRGSIFVRLAVLHDGQQGARNVSLDGDARNIHVVADFRVAVAG